MTSDNFKINDNFVIKLVFLNVNITRKVVQTIIGLFFAFVVHI